MVKSKNDGITFIIPRLAYHGINDIKKVMKQNDRLFCFNTDIRGFVRTVNQRIGTSVNQCIVLVNPNSNIMAGDVVDKIRRFFTPDKCMVFDYSGGLSDNAWLVIPKQRYKSSRLMFDSTKHLQANILSYNTNHKIYVVENGDVKGSAGKPMNISPKIVKNADDIFSIIVPFMYNGDRWPLFKASIQSVYKHTKNHDNIEIVVHETSPKRHITDAFIKRYGMVHLYSEYDDLFHRSWNLNVAAKYLARGNVLIFFDADLIIDDVWVNELLSCDTSKAYMGWGKMMNLDENGTYQYLKDKTLIGSIDRTRLPEALSAAAGINVVPRDIFFSIGGWPESYKGLGYGGEDNSFAYKMIKLGIYGKMSDHIFKSSVYHLFHGHQTKRCKGTLPVFKRHEKYTKEDWFEHIRRWHNWGKPVGDIDVTTSKPYINETLLYVYKNSKKTRITLCMVNFLRYEILIKNLESFLALGVPINLILWVNQSDSMPPKIKTRVNSLLSKFADHDVTYSKKNMGTGYPRYMMLSKARHEFNTDYVMTTDDDVFYQNPESLVLGATILDQEEYMDYGSMGLWVNPHYTITTKNENTLKSVKAYEGFHTVDCLGAATMTIRRDVLDVCNCDPLYVIGLVDWDFSLSIGKGGFKLGLVCDDMFKPTNETKGNTKEYMNSRYATPVIDNSKKRFMVKWGITV